MTETQLKRIDKNPIPDRPGEIRAFACIRNEAMRLPFMLDYHRKLGVDRFFFIDNRSDDATRDFLLAQRDCHTFDCDGNFFAENVDPPVWTNALRNVFGDGHWSLSLDADEMLVYPRCETVPLPELCTYLDRTGATGLPALVLDMYGKGPIVKVKYRRGQSFLSACPFFDPELGWTVAADGQVPPVLMFSRFRERAFWHGSHRRKRAPCITQVPLARWRKSMAYLVAQHSLTDARLSELQGAVLHFKFLPGFFESTVTSLADNRGVEEKGLEERKSYVDALAEDPMLDLHHDGSQRYSGSRQLVSLGWMKTSSDFAEFVAQHANAKRTVMRRAPARTGRAASARAARQPRRAPR